jgi:molybdate transport system regulatory protein
MASSGFPLRLKVQLSCGDEFALGPGKADLLAAIADTGSISAAGRQLGFSYRRTWLLVDTMNRCWREPLVATAHGGPRGGGATLTPLGESVLARYRALAATLAATAEPAAADFAADLLPTPRPAAHR